MANWLRWAAAAMLLVALASPVNAGTPEDPEISDAGDDSGSPVAGQDILAAFIEDEPVMNTGETPELSLKVHVQVAGDFEHAPGFFAASVRFRVSFVPEKGLPGGMAEAYVNVVPSRQSTSTPVTAVPNGPESVGCRFGVTDTEGGSQDVAEELVLVGELVSATDFACYLPLSMLPGMGDGSQIANLLVQQQLVQRGPLSGGDDAGVNVIETFDVAPDAGFGREYFVGGPPPEEAPPAANDTVETPGNVTEAVNDPSEGNETMPEMTAEPTPVPAEDRSVPEQDADAAPAEDAKKSTPGLETALLVAAVAASAFLARRRTT